MAEFQDMTSETNAFSELLNGKNMKADLRFCQAVMAAGNHRISTAKPVNGLTSKTLIKPGYIHLRKNLWGLMKSRNSKAIQRTTK